MRLTIPLVTAAASLAAFLGVSPALAQAGGQRLKLVEIIDPNGFERPMPAARIMIPAHWQSRGGVVWSQRVGCSVDATRMEWAAWDPNGPGAVEIMPEIAWQASNLQFQAPSQGNCLNAGFRSVREFLHAFVQLKRPGAAIIDYRDRPDLIGSLAAINSQPGLGGDQRSWAEMGEILIGYPINGGRVQENIRGGAIFNVMRMAGVYPGEVREFLTGSSVPALAMRVPEGGMDFRLFDTIHKSIAVDPEWQARMNRHNNVIAQTNARGSADRARIANRTQTEINDMRNKSWNEQQKSLDRNHENVIRTIRGQELYADPQAGRPVELPNTYNHAWRLQDGTYLMTDDPNFNPSGALGVNGTQLQRTR